MDLREILQILWRRRAAMVLGLLVGTAASALTIYRIDLGLPPMAERRSIENGSASTQLLVDLPQSAIAKTGRPLEGLTSRAGVLAFLIETPPVVERVARRAGLTRNEIAVHGAPPAGASRGRATSAEERSTEILTEEDRYRLVAAAESNTPVVSIYATAPTPREAIRLVDAAAHVLPGYMRELQVRQNVAADLRLQIRVFGATQGGWVNRGADYTVAGLAFLAGLLVWALTLTVLSRVREAIARERARTLLAGTASIHAPGPGSDEGLP